MKFKSLLLLGALCSYGYCDNQPSAMPGNEVTPQQNALNSNSQTPTQTVNPSEGGLIGNPYLNTAGIYQMGGTLFVDRNLKVKSVATSSMTVTTATITTLAVSSSVFTNETITNLTVSSFTATNVSFTNVAASSITASNATLTNIHSSSITADNSTITTLHTSSLTANTETIGVTLTVPNGAAATDAMAFGQNKVIQQVNNFVQSSSATTSTAGAGFASAGLSASITPTSSSNKVLIFVTGTFRYGGTSLGNQGLVTLFRGTVNGTDFSAGNGLCSALVQVSGVNIDETCSIVYLDSPATTSPTTYTVGMRAANNDTLTWAVGNAGATIELLEIH